MMAIWNSLKTKLKELQAMADKEGLAMVYNGDSFTFDAALAVPATMDALPGDMMLLFGAVVAVVIYASYTLNSTDLG